jgi:hypothetical protein
MLLNKIKDENDEGDFSDRREKVYKLLPIGMFEKGLRVAKKQPSLKRKKGRFQRGNRYKSIRANIQFQKWIPST